MAHYDTNSLHITPTIATQEHPVRLFATQQPPAHAGPANPGSENFPIFVASTVNTPIFVASTAGSPISVSSTAPTPVAAPRDAKFVLKVPKGVVPFRAQSVGTPTPVLCALQPFPMPPPSPNFGKATPSPGLVASMLQPQANGELPAAPATALTASGAILIPDSDDEDEEGKGKHPIGSVIVIGDSDDDSTLPQRPYPSHPPALLSPMPATPLKGTRRFKPLFADEGYSPGEFFNTDGNPDDIAVSSNAPNVSLRARQLEKIERYMKMPSTDLEARSAARRAARAPKHSINSNAASTSALPQDGDNESDYGIPEFNAAGLQEVDAILDSLANSA